MVNFKEGDDKWIPRPLVFCNDLVGFIKELLNLRSLRADDVQVKVGLDGGKGHLKLILSLYEPDNLQVNKRGHSRVTRDLGIGCGPDFSLLGRKKIMILATTPDTPENYFNLQFIYDTVGVNQVNYKQTGDFKALNILLGLMSCSSLCGCPYCEAKRSHYEWTDGGAKLRSVASLNQNLERFTEYGGGDKIRSRPKSSVLTL